MKRNKQCGYYKVSYSGEIIYIKIIAIYYMPNPFCDSLYGALTNTFHVVQAKTIGKTAEENISRFVRHVKYHDRLETNIDSPVSFYFPTAIKISRDEYLNALNSYDIITYEDKELLRAGKVDFFSYSYYQTHCVATAKDENGNYLNDA